MIAIPYGVGVPDESGEYPGAMYAPVTSPTAVPYAVPAPSTAMVQQQAAPLTPVPLNAYAPTQPASLLSLPVVSPTVTDDCGCGSRPLKWYEIVAAVALVVIAVAAFRK